MKDQFPYLWVIVCILLRGGIVVLFLLLAAFLLRDTHRRASSKLGALMLVSAAAQSILMTPGAAFTITPWHAPLYALTASSPFSFWLFSRSLLHDGFKLRAWHGVALTAMASIGISVALMERPLSPAQQRINVLWLTVPALSLVALTALQTFVSWRSDLVEARRRARMFIIVAGLVYLGMLHVVILGRADGLRSLLVNNLIALPLLVIGIGVAWKMLRVDTAELFPQLPEAPFASPDGDDADDGPVDPASAPPDPRAQVPLDAQELKLVDTLVELMEVEQVYRDEPLTMGALARRMKVPEHRLRRLISQGLEHRNFNAFLNAYRIQDAKRSLADPLYADVSILTISVDAGFQSLGPFNRAFKAATGVTPTEFRRAAAERSGAAVAPGDSRLLADSSM